VVVDLGRFVNQTGAAYAVVDTEDQALRFILEDEMADALAEALYLRP